MFGQAYNKDISIFRDDFAHDKSIISSRNENVEIEISNGKNIFYLKESHKSFQEIINFQTNYFLKSEQELIFSFCMNPDLASCINIPFQLKINGIVIEYNKGFISNDTHTITVYNPLTQKSYGSFNPPRSYIFNIKLRRIGNICYLYNNNSLISELSVDEFNAIKNTISISWHLKMDIKVDLQLIELRQIKKAEDEYFIEKDHIEFFLNGKMLNEDIDIDSTFYYLCGKGEKLFLKKEKKDTQYKTLYISLFEVTEEGIVYFCLNRKRISYINEGIIARIASYKNRICDNPELIEKLLIENCTFNLSILKIIGLMDCAEFKLPLDDILNIRHKINKDIENYLKIELQDIRSTFISDLNYTNNSFDFKFITKENNVIVSSNSCSNYKQISFEFDEFNLDNFELSIGFDLNKTDSIKINILDFTIDLGVWIDKIDCESDDGEIIYHDYRYSNYVNIHYLKEDRKIAVLSKSIPYLFKSYYILKIQKISDYFFFLLNDIYLGITIRQPYTFCQTNKHILSFICDQDNSLIILDKLIIKEIIKHKLFDLPNQIKNFSSDRLFYVSLWRDYDKPDSYGGGRNDFYIEKITYFDKAKDEIENRFCSFTQKYRNQLSDYFHYVITNDFKLINRYRNAIEIEEFIDQTYFYQDVFIHFSFILLGLCIQCRSFEAKEDYYDVDNGNSYYVPVDSGWIFHNSVVFNKISSYDF